MLTVIMSTGNRQADNRQHKLLDLAQYALKIHGNIEEQNTDVKALVVLLEMANMG